MVFCTLILRFTLVKYVRGWSTKILKFQLSRIVKMSVNIRGYIWNVYGDVYWFFIYRLKKTSRIGAGLKIAVTVYSRLNSLIFKNWYRSIELWIWRAWEKHESCSRLSREQLTLASRVLSKLPKFIVTRQTHSQKYELVLLVIDIGNKRETTLFHDAIKFSFMRSRGNQNLVRFHCLCQCVFGIGKFPTKGRRYRL
jgi:hypothetical protein